MRPLFLTAVLIFVCFHAIGQEIVFKASLKDRGTRNGIALAEVLNLRTRAKVGSNDFGYFQILAKVGDTLLIQKRNYVPKNVIVSLEETVLIYMEAEFNQIEQVDIVRSTRKSDLETIKKSFRDKGTYYDGKPPLALLNPFGGSPLTFFYELFGKTPRNARRFARYYDSEMKEITIEQFFNKRLIVEQTKLEGVELDNFIASFRPSFEQAEKWSEYDAIAYINKSFKVFKENPDAYKNKLVLPQN